MHAIINSKTKMIEYKKRKEAERKELEEKQLKAEEKEKQREQRRIIRVKELCFDKYDTNNDGVLQKSELKEYINDICKRNDMPEPAEVFYSMLFKSCDDDKNETINFDEFMKHFGQ